MTYFETEKVELKRVLNEAFEKEVVAFLNTHDGVIYIGVEDNGEVCGVDKVDETMKKIADIIATGILPNPQELIKVRALYDEGKLIVEVEVKKGNALYYINKYGRSSKGCYIRVGTSCRSMTEEQIEKAYTSYLTFPETRMKDVSVLRKDYTFTKLKNYLLSKGISYNEDTFLENFNLITVDGKYNLIADLLADENMTSIKIAVFKGKDKSKFVKRNEYGNTCLIHSLKQVLDYCEALNDIYVDLSVSPRREKKMFNFEAVKEAWVNACVHNRWVDGTPPAIYWFEDRMEIISYGGIPKGLTKEQFLKGKTKPVNKELMDIFLQCKVVEQSGHGVPTVVDVYGEDAYEFSEDSITVTIPFDKTGFDGHDVHQNVHQKTDLEIIIDLINENSKVTLKEMAASIGKSVKTVQRVINDYGKIKYIGSSKSGHWEIIE